MFNNNKHFASQCTPLQNSSSLSNFCLTTEKLLKHSLNIGEDDIFAIIKNLNLINTMDGIIGQSE